MNHNLLILLFLLALLAFVLQRKHSKHKRNIKKARNIRNKLLTFENPGSIINYLRKINPFVFEELLLESFKKKGYKIKRNKRYTGDGGIDGKVYINNELFLIQAKRYSSSINPSHIIKFANTIRSHKAKGGYFIHTGRTGPKSNTHIAFNNIQIISGDKLIKLITNYGNTQ